VVRAFLCKEKLWSKRKQIPALQDMTQFQRQTSLDAGSKSGFLSKERTPDTSKKEPKTVKVFGAVQALAKNK